MARRKTPKWKKEIRKLKKNFKELPFKRSGLIFIIIAGWLNMLLPLGTTNSFFSDVETGQIAVSVGVWGETPVPAVLLNEFLPRPHDDSGFKPDGEWVELYNLSDTETIDLAGYYIKDNLDPTSGPSHKIYIENCRTNTGGTTIGPNGFLVVYAKGDAGGCNSHGFELNNAGDTVRLFNDNDELIDSYSYDGSEYCSLTPTPGDPNENDSSGNCSGVVPKNKSFARVPDGTGPWYDPIPTPGGPNILEESAVSLPVLETIIIRDFIEPEQTVYESLEPFVSPELLSELTATSSPILDSPQEQTPPEETPIIEEIATTTPEIIITPEVATTTEATTTPIIQQEIPPAIEEQPVVVEETIIVEPPQPEPEVSTDASALVDESVDTVTEPAILTEPTIIEPLAEPAPPPADPPASTE